VTIHEHQKRRHQRCHSHEELTGKLCLVFPLTRPGVHAPHDDRHSSRANLVDDEWRALGLVFQRSDVQTSYLDPFLGIKYVSTLCVNSPVASAVHASRDA